MSAAALLVVADRLTKYFPMGRGQQVHAVDGVSLTIHEQEIVGLVGESGSGKSTFGKALIGLHPKRRAPSATAASCCPSATTPKTSSAGRRRCR
jgi:ABC-type glutathione transport system ATPase component